MFDLGTYADDLAPLEYVSAPMKLEVATKPKPKPTKPKPKPGY